MIFEPKNTWARRNRRPMIRELRNVALISFGVALVATSKSFGVARDEQVADAATDEVRLVAGAGELADHAIGIGVDRGAVERWHRADQPYHAARSTDKYANLCGVFPASPPPTAGLPQRA